MFFSILFSTTLATSMVLLVFYIIDKVFKTDHFYNVLGIIVYLGLVGSFLLACSLLVFASFKIISLLTYNLL